MKNVYGILNLHGGPSLGKLTDDRPLGSISFLGRYGIMDFALSNLSNSGIDKIAILVESNSHSIRSHIQGGQIWINNTKTGDLGEYLNERALSTPKFNTDIANIKANLSPIDKQIVEDYVVIAAPHMVMSLDYSKVVDAHIASGADVTLVYSHRKDADKEFINDTALVFDNSGKVVKFTNNLGRKAEADICLDTYVINKTKLIEFVEKAEDISSLFNLMDVMKSSIRDGSVNIRGYAFDGLVLPITSLQNYVKYSFALLKEDLHDKLFKEDWPVYTTTHNTAPTIYGENAQVKNSFIANGSRIDGKVENSIISRNVTVEEGAVVKNSIIFTKTSISSGVTVEYVLAGKHASIREIKKLKGTADEILFIKYGAKV